ncbi:MAG: hypothetical protein AB7N80_00760 [Bdellovibrionales bacterium]
MADKFGMNGPTRYLLFLGLMLLAHLPAKAEELDKASQEALQKTTELLTNRAQREEAIKKDTKAQGADKMVDQVSGGGQNKEDVYGLASDVFADLVKETGGDAQKMQELLQKMARDPASFANRWTPEQRARLQRMADQMSPKSAPK